jgi:hypothetical protein
MTARSTIAWLAGSAVLLGSVPLAQQTNWDDVRRRVPKIDSVFGTEAGERGAGLVVGVEAGDVFIATAAHVVENPSGPATTIHVSLPSPSGQVFDGATIVEHDVRLDIALLRLRAPELAGQFADAGRICYRLPVADEPVTTIGHPLDALWQVSSINNVVTKEYNNDPRLFTISGKGVARGSSGGPVLGADGCLIGFVSRTSAVETVVVTGDRIVNLVAPAIELSMLGGNSGADEKLRRQTFDAVSTSLNSYVFDLEAVLVIFRRTSLDTDSVARTITHYNDTYRAMFDGRSAIAAQISDRFGKKRGDDYLELVNFLDTGHKQLIYGRLQDLLVQLRANKKLTNNEKKELAQILQDLDAHVRDSKTRVAAYIEVLRAALSRPSAPLAGERR